MRTPGGRAINLPNTIFAVDTWIGYKDIMVIQHTGMHPIPQFLYYLADESCGIDCGVTHMDEGEVRAELKKRAPAHAHEVDAFQFPFSKEYVSEGFITFS
jgi:hypothetical protein